MYFHAILPRVSRISPRPLILCPVVFLLQPLNLQTFEHSNAVSTIPLTHLNATLTNHPASVDSKQLTTYLNPLESTLTKNRGGWGGVIVNQTCDEACLSRATTGSEGSLLPVIKESVRASQLSGVQTLRRFDDLSRRSDVLSQPSNLPAFCASGEDAHPERPSGAEGFFSASFCPVRISPPCS